MLLKLPWGYIGCSKKSQCGHSDIAGNKVATLTVDDKRLDEHQLYEPVTATTMKLNLPCGIISSCLYGFMSHLGVHTRVHAQF